MEKDIQQLCSKLAVSNPKDAQAFCQEIPGKLQALSGKYKLRNLSPIPNLRIAFLCYAWSEIFQKDVVVKMIPPYLQTYASESAGYRCLDTEHKYMCPVLAFEDSLDTLILPKLMPPVHAGSVLPGLDALLDAIGKESIPYINNESGTPTYKDIYQLTVKKAAAHASALDLSDEDFPATTCSRIWDEFFSHEPLYICHGDIHAGNLMQDQNGYLLAIDPLAYASPYPFRFTRYILVPGLFDRQDKHNLEARFQYAMKFCHGCSENKLRQATIIDCHFLLAALLVQSDRDDVIRNLAVPLMKTVFNHFSLI